jgi:hypothetical protein
MVEVHQSNVDNGGASSSEVQIDEAAVVIEDDADEGIELEDV